jgi:hypothetical protein
MTGYLAAIFFATVFMLLHLAEWRTASAMAERLHSESKSVAEVRRLRRAIRVEALPRKLCSSDRSPGGRKS